MEFGFVWWVDISVKFTKWNISHAIDYVRKNSILFFVSSDDHQKASMTAHTDVRTFQFLGEDICKFRPFNEVWATTAMFHFDEVTKTIVKAWASCALNEDCIAPRGSDRKLQCSEHSTADGQCHRFDQSVLSILIRRVFHEGNVYPINNRFRDLFFVTRREFVDYFERCRFQITCY